MFAILFFNSNLGMVAARQAPPLVCAASSTPSRLIYCWYRLFISVADFANAAQPIFASETLSDIPP
jgi:hypothetical protein